MGLFGLLVLGLLTGVTTAQVLDLTFVVTSTGDESDTLAGDGLCLDSTGNCTLRAAIEESNANAGNDTINFAIGTGAQTLLLGSELPWITGPVVIDATTQPGYLGAPLVEVDASLAAFGNGFTIDWVDGVTIKGFAIGGASGSAITINGGTGHVIRDNYLGTHASGTDAFPNGEDGIHLQDADHVLIANNVISNSASNGISLLFYEVEVHNISIVNNLIGTDADGAQAFGNGGHGIFIDAAVDVSIGDNDAGANTIANNGASGILVAAGSRVSIRMNQIRDNGQLGIDLAQDGVTGNDAGDADEGANDLVNFPDLLSADVADLVLQSEVPLPSAAGTLVGSYDGAPSSNFTLEFFWSETCDDSGHGEGAEFLTSQLITTDLDGLAPFEVGVDALTAPGYVTATATDERGSTSEFSPCVNVGPADLSAFLFPDLDPTYFPSPITFLATITNNGPGRATGVEAEFALPEGATLVDVAQDGASQFALTVSPNDDQLRTVSLLDASTVDAVTITTDDFVVAGAIGLTVQPGTGRLFTALKPVDSNDRWLAWIDPSTGEATLIDVLRYTPVSSPTSSPTPTGEFLATSTTGTLLKSAALAFASDGTLYSVSGDGGTNAESLFSVDPATAQATFLVALGRGTDGEALAYNEDDDLLYHASGHSGDSEVIFETIDRSTFETVDIPIAGTDLVIEETQALTYEGAGTFLWVQDHGFPAPLYRVTTSGVPVLLGELDHQAKGIVLADVAACDESEGLVTCQVGTMEPDEVVSYEFSVLPEELGTHVASFAAFGIEADDDLSNNEAAASALWAPTPEATRLVFGEHATQLTVGETFGLGLDIVDQLDLPFTDGSHTVTLSKQVGSSSGRLDGTLSGSTVEGSVFFEGLSFDAPGTYRIVARSSGLGAGLSDLIIVNPPGIESVASIELSVPSLVLDGDESYHLGAGESAQLVAQAFDEGHNLLAGFVFEYSVTHDEAQDPAFVDVHGLLQAFHPGSIEIVAYIGLGETEVYSNTLHFELEAGELSKIVLDPSSAASDGLAPITFNANGTDAFDNPLGPVAVLWSIDGGPTTGPTTTKEFPAAASDGSHTLRASLGSLSRTALVQITDTVIGAGETEEVLADDVQSTANGVTSTLLSAAVAQADAGATIDINPPSGTASNVQDALVTLERQATNLAINIETQVGTLDSPPAEVDPADLASVLEDLGTSDAPAIFLSINAVEDGESLTSDELNDLLETMTIQFKVPVAYFAGNGLDPAVLVVVSYSDSHAPTTVVATFLGQTGSFYSYSIEIDEFSAFAVIGGALSAGGGGGGGGGGHDATKYVNYTVRVGDAFLRDIEIKFEMPAAYFEIGKATVIGFDLSQANASFAPLPAGAQALRVFEVDFGTPQLKVVSATLRMVLPQGETFDVEGVVLLRQVDGVWRAENPVRFGTGPDGIEARVVTGCCSYFAMVKDTEGPTLGLSLPSGEVSGVVRLAAQASDNLGAVRVQWFVDEKLVGTDDEAPYELDVNSRELSNGVHTVRVVATDLAGHSDEAAGSLNVLNLASPVSDHDDEGATISEAPGPSLVGPVLGILAVFTLVAFAVAFVVRRTKGPPPPAAGVEAGASPEDLAGVEPAASPAAPPRIEAAAPPEIPAAGDTPLPPDQETRP